MSEAQSYQAGNIDKDRVVYLASDFDNVTRLFLDAAERCIASERREKELQQRLTAADEELDRAGGYYLNKNAERLQLRKRADLLEGLLAKYYNRSDFCAFMAKDIGAALKPAETVDDSCEFCKGWGFRTNPDGADEGCGACNGTGKEPSDDQP